jgi:transcriptional regulator NrdR family protein
MYKCKCGNDVASNARTCPKCGHRFTSMPVKMLAWFFGLVAVCGVLGAMLSNNSSTSPPAAPAVALTPAQKSFTMQGDQAAKLIGKCGKPYKDFTKVEGGQPIRHVIYKKQNVELMYSREGVPAWVLVGIFRANADENIDKDEANRRLPCAAGSIRTVLD